MLTGSCFCEALEYELRAPIQQAQCCHCSRCRKVFSGAGSAFGFVAQDSFCWKGETSTLRRYATENGWEIGFCGACGSTLCGILDGEVRGVTLGSVDGDPGVHIQRHIFVGSKAPWDHIGGDAPQFEEHDGSDPLSERDERVVRELDQRWNDVYVNNDRAPFSEILADDLRLTWPDGRSELAKPKMMEKTPDGRRVTFSERSFEIHGSSAITRGRIRVEHPEGPVEQRFVRVFAKRGDRWQAVSVHVFPVETTNNEAR